MSTRANLSWGSNTLELLPERAAWDPQRRALLVADLHLGKAESFQAQGIPLPSDIKGIDFTNASLDFKDGFLALALTPSTQNWIRLGSAISTRKTAILSKMEASVSVVQF